MDNPQNTKRQPKSLSPKLKWTIRLLFLLFLGVASFYIIKRHQQMEMRTAQGKIFGTTYMVKYISSEDLTQDIVKELDAVNASLSIFDENSTISKINQNITDTIDEHVRYVFNLATQVSQATDGAFDITVGPLVNLWGFGFKNRGNVTDAQIDSLLPLVGYKMYRIEGKSVVKDNVDMVFDCGAVAKGYGVDRVAHALQQHGVVDYMVEIGGEVVAKGHKDKGQPWVIGISTPSENAVANQEIEAKITLSNKAVATSGNYLNYYEKDGKRYAHTIDPKTGRPVQHSLLSATVIAADCATADAYATSFMVMGLEKARQVLAKHKDLQAFFICDDGKGGTTTWSTDGFKKMVSQ